MHNLGALAIPTLWPDFPASGTAVELCVPVGKVPSQKFRGLLGGTSPKRCFGYRVTSLDKSLRMPLLNCQLVELCPC